ncbi:MAG: CtsR family transcriptional regulator [Bacillota bacterium]|uniref:CtsR family transcriptional regulator n=2 Tax=Thermanaerosceptrum fracticalcis TaxID=1712410 RepID=A0A7G6E5R0_THEFR|nr:CtsR family transcriptional regulator [Thermanaerosceptrum fracticalcis]
MKMSLAKRIEEYIKRLLQEENVIEIQRSELAEEFQCVPSQINYVLSTRFTPAQGYLVESRRGGGGYLRIIKLSWDKLSQKEIQDVYSSFGDSLDQWEAEGILRRLKEEDILTDREYYMLKAIISRDTLQISLPERDFIRLRILQAALTAISRDDL